MDAAALRAEFPALERLAYLNAGTDGPLPSRALEAAYEELEREVAYGRLHSHFERRGELSTAVRVAYAARLGAQPEDVALTSSTSEGLATVVEGLSLEPGDEIVTSDQEHPGMLGALQAARDLRGARITIAPFARVHEAVGSATRLVATSHVSWVGGELAPTGLRELDVPVLLDGAQGVGALPVDPVALGADAYAGAGQKWLCGPDGTGMLFVSEGLREGVPPTRRAFGCFADTAAGLDAPLQPDARRYHATSQSAEAHATALAAHEVLEAFGWDRVHERGITLAARLADELAQRGHEVAPRGPTTLVSWASDDPEAERERLAEQGIAIRDIPGRGLLRASVGAWNDERDLERLLDALRGAQVMR
jgi:L-cysteine/cystine lyase